MKKLGLFFMILSSAFCFGQVNDNFSDGNFSGNPVWEGVNTHFCINASGQLQSTASGASVSWLFTPSAAINNAVWECSVKINYPTSSSNYAAFYIVSDKSDLSEGCKGYYVQIGGTNDEVALYLQQGTQKTKIIDGVDKRTDGNPVEIDIRVMRDHNGNFQLFSRKPSEPDYVLEGSAFDPTIVSSFYSGVLYSNTSTTGSDYIFDNFVVVGDRQEDHSAPLLDGVKIVGDSIFSLNFTEPVEFNPETAWVRTLDESLLLDSYANNKHTALFKTTSSIIYGKLYTLYIKGLKDGAGNTMRDTCVMLGRLGVPNMGEVVINEIMCEQPLGSAEYVELFNRSDLAVDISDYVVGVLRSDNTWSKIAQIPANTTMSPASYLALTAYPDSVRNHHACPPNARLLQTRCSALNNESATLALLNAKCDTIIDQVAYQSAWHHVLVKNPKGVALEKINPSLNSSEASSWHSASSETHYGTPGYKNSQYREVDPVKLPDISVSVEPEAFTPDNDGVDDVCFIRYKMDTVGYVANVRILTPSGYQVCQLQNNVLLSAEGFISWDGQTSKNQNVNPGVYLIYFEIFNPNTGIAKNFKKLVVVSLR